MIRSAARAARSGSSSWAAGTPKYAQIPSPMNAWITPPKSSTARLIRVTHSPTSALTSSGPSRSPRPVDPTMSANSAVIGRISSCGRGSSPTGTPFAPQPSPRERGERGHPGRVSPGTDGDVVPPYGPITTRRHGPEGEGDEHQDRNARGATYEPLDLAGGGHRLAGHAVGRDRCVLPRSRHGDADREVGRRRGRAVRRQRDRGQHADRDLWRPRR